MWINSCRSFTPGAVLALFSLLVGIVNGAPKEPTLSPSGLAVLQEKLKSHPAFDDARVRADAEKKFKLFKIGDEVSVKDRKGQVSGAFRGMDKMSITVGDKHVLFMDMDEKDAAQFSESRTRELRNQYIRLQQESYNIDKKALEDTIREELSSKYPTLGKKRLAELFSKLENKELSESLATEFLTAYDKSLPLVEAKTDHVLKVAKEFAEGRKDIVFDDGFFHSVEEVEAKKKQAEADARRLDELHKIADQRAKERMLMPKTASPVFKPDGGALNPKQTIEITCPTPDAVIKFTLDGKEPTEDSPTYEGALTVSSSKTVVKAKAFHPIFNDSEIAVSAVFTEQPQKSAQPDKVSSGDEPKTPSKQKTKTIKKK